MFGIQSCQCMCARVLYVYDVNIDSLNFIHRITASYLTEMHTTINTYNLSIYLYGLVPPNKWMKI